VNIVQNKSLTFAFPEVWEDPYEFYPFNCYFDECIKGKKSNLIMAALLYSIKINTYAQCWTSLKESDALWRIYDKKGTGIRIRIKVSDISSLNDISFVKVKYYDSIENIDYKQFDNNDFEQLFAIKRKAFAHEKEIRLLSRFKLSRDNDEIKKHIKAFLVTHSKDFREQFIEQSSDESIEILIKKLDNLLNETGFINLPKFKSISFEHIPNFIDSVMLSPFAANWFENTISVFCKNNDIKFIGKSKLYAPMLNE